MHSICHALHLQNAKYQRAKSHSYDCICDAPFRVGLYAHWVAMYSANTFCQIGTKFHRHYAIVSNRIAVATPAHVSCWYNTLGFRRIEGRHAAPSSTFSADNAAACIAAGSKMYRHARQPAGNPPAPSSIWLSPFSNAATNRRASCLERWQKGVREAATRPKTFRPSVYLALPAYLRESAAFWIRYLCLGLRTLSSMASATRLPCTFP